MQTLGLSASEPRTENRLKSLFWPSIQNGNDVDYLGAQGYWVCVVVAVLSCTFSAMSGHPITGAVLFLFFYLGGVGVREHSRYAAAAVFVLYVLDMLASVPSVLKVILAAVLLSNLRATWIASHWKPESEEAALPPRLGETWSDRFVDKLPMWLWPKVRIFYYVLSACLLLVAAVGLTTIILHRLS
jgi:hypothetical protein